MKNKLNRLKTIITGLDYYRTRVGKIVVINNIVPESGFFFGGTDYDDWYYRKLKATLSRFKRFNAKFRKGKWNYFYHSSW